MTRELIEKEVLNDREIYDLLEIPVPDELADAIEPSAQKRNADTPQSSQGESSEDASEESKLPKDIDPVMLGLEGS